jgi:putative tributyrin esterase
MKVFRFAFFVVLAAFALASIGCRTGQLPLLDQPRSFAGVSTRDVEFLSKALGRTMPYRVYLPASVPEGRRLLVVYLLHGNGGTYRDWSNYSDAGSYATNGTILVMPDGAGSYYENAALKPEDRYEDFLVDDLLADVETRFPACAGRENRAIVGVSMGGFAAVKLALTRPDLFAFAGAISPAIDVPSRRFSWRRWSQSAHFRTIFGPVGSDTRAKSDPFVLVKSADPRKTPYLYVTAGDKEQLLEPIRRFTGLLKQNGYAYEFHTKHGGHDWSEWNAQIPGCFESLLAHMVSVQRGELTTRH